MPVLRAGAEPDPQALPPGVRRHPNRKERRRMWRHETDEELADRAADERTKDQKTDTEDD